MINTVFDENKIDYRVTEVPDSLRVLIHAEEINEYLSCMGADLSFYKSSNGVALTTLYGISTILSENADEYNKPCLENGFIIIGAGPNGDLLCVNCSTGRVGYAFGAELWEQNFSTFSDIYIELPLSIEQFIVLMLKDKENYPFDGSEAEDYLKEKTFSKSNQQYN